jgi:hypothetical protein
MSGIKGYRVYNIFRKKNNAHLCSFPTQELCHAYMKMRKEYYYSEVKSLDLAEEYYGEGSYYINYGFALIQSSAANFFDDFSTWL